MGDHYKAEQFISAIPGSGGIVTTIAKRVGCEWHTAKKYITNYATVTQAYTDECEKVLDAAESVVVGNIVESKDVQTAKWYLTMKGADRGYAPKQKLEHSGEGGGPIQTKEVGLTDAERLAALTAMLKQLPEEAAGPVFDEGDD